MTMTMRMRMTMRMTMTMTMSMTMTTLFSSFSDGGRPYKEEVRPSEKVEEDDKDGREEQEDCLDLRIN